MPVSELGGGRRPQAEAARPPHGRRTAAATAAVTAAVPAAAPAQEPPTVATHYFYWYRWPDEHFDPEDEPHREGHRHHFVDQERVSYLDPEWHAANFRAMAWLCPTISAPSAYFCFGMYPTSSSSGR